MSNMIKIKDLYANIGEKKILKGLNLELEEGRVHVIMGPNGAGKSTLSKAIVGHYDIEVKKGEIIYKGENIVKEEPEIRALKGIFMSFQNPVEVPGVNNAYFLRMAVNAKRKFEGKEELNAAEFLRKAKEFAKELGMKPELLNRSLNEGFSGGEKKRNETLQMLMLEPDFIILDEIDSGLDVDALRAVSEGINKLKDGKRTFLIITHYSRILEYVGPDFVHVLKDGRIVKSGTPDLVAKLEEEGYTALGES